MTVHVVIREDQSEHGFIDTSVVKLFRSRSDAEAFVQSSIREARGEGLHVFGDPADDRNWDVSWTVEAHSLS